MALQVHFRNSYGPRIWVAIMFKNDGCASYGRPWGTRGWWTIDSGQTVHVLNTNNRYAYFYAEAADGSVWSGDRGPMYVTQQAFDSCVDIGSTNARIVGAQEIYIPDDGRIFSFVG